METHFIFLAFFLSLWLSNALCVYLTFIAHYCSIYIPKVKLWLLQINIEDEISINSKIHIIKTYFNWMEICSNFIEIALRHGYSHVNLLHIFRTPFPKSTSWWLLLPMSAWNIVTFTIQNWYLWSAVLKFSPKYFWDSWILVHCRSNSYFAFITKKKLHVSLFCSFYYCLVKEGWALKVT